MNVCGVERIDDEKEKRSFTSSICWISPADTCWKPKKSCRCPVGGPGIYRDLLSPICRVVQVAHNKNLRVVIKNDLESFYTEFHWVWHTLVWVGHRLPCIFIQGKSFRMQMQPWVKTSSLCSKRMISQRPSGSVRHAPGSYKALRQIPALYANNTLPVYVLLFSCPWLRNALCLTSLLQDTKCFIMNM